MKLVFFLLFISTFTYSQVDFEKEYEERYQDNIKKEFINDIYIPLDFSEAFDELHRLASQEALVKFKMGKEEIVSRKLHFGLGRWIAVNWNFEGGSRFSHIMKEMGVTFPDDMIQMTIISFHRHLNDKPLMLQDQATTFFEKRKTENDERKLRSAEIVIKN